MTELVNPAPLRIVIADDQAAVREGLAVMLGLLPDIEVVAAVGNGQDAVDRVLELDPDAVLLDLHMPVLDGVGAARLIHEARPNVAIVVLTTYADDESIRAALRVGARSYLTKDSDRTDIARALRAASSGLSVLDPAVQASLLASAESGSGPAAGERIELPDGLTAREGEILGLIADGATNAEIAQRLVVSSHTVKSHINRIFAKTGSANRGAAMRYAREHGLAD